MIATPTYEKRRPHAGNAVDGGMTQQTNLDTIVAQMDALLPGTEWRTADGPLGLLRLLDTACAEAVRQAQQSGTARDDEHAHELHALLGDVAAHLHYVWSARDGWTFQPDKAVQHGR